MRWRRPATWASWISGPNCATGCLTAAVQGEASVHWSADPGGWAWTPLPGGVPDADDTPGAILALHLHLALGHLGDMPPRYLHDGLMWLVQLQNHDGGMPTFCHGWGRLPFDRSGCDLTAHALRTSPAGEAGNVLRSRLCTLAIGGDGAFAIEGWLIRSPRYHQWRTRLPCPHTASRRLLAASLVRQPARSQRRKPHLRHRPCAGRLPRPR